MSPGFPRADPVPLIAFHPAQHRDAPGPGAHRGEGTQSLSPWKALASRRVALWAESGSRRRRGGAHSGTRAWAGPPPSPAWAPGASHPALLRCSRCLLLTGLAPPSKSHLPSLLRTWAQKSTLSSFLSLTIKIKQKYNLSPGTAFEAQFPCLHNEDRNTNKYINSQLC